VLLREERTGYLHQSVSDDGGRTWSQPQAAPMWGSPPHLLALPDGRLLCTYGHRRPPFGIRACLSRDGGETWDIDLEVIVRDDFPNGNLGYPSAVVAAPGVVFLAYSGGDPDGVTCLPGSYVALPD
jgi:sialidase-1